MRAWPINCTRTRTACPFSHTLALFVLQWPSIHTGGWGRAAAAIKLSTKYSPATSSRFRGHGQVLYGAPEDRSGTAGVALQIRARAGGVRIGRVPVRTACPTTMRVELIGHFQPCMTDIYLHIDARMADYIRTHPYRTG